MTKIITRYFDSVENARAAQSELTYRRRLARGIVAVFDDPSAMSGALSSANIADNTVKA